MQHPKDPYGSRCSKTIEFDRRFDGGHDKTPFDSFKTMSLACSSRCQGLISRQRLFDAHSARAKHFKGSSNEF
jgi:hypothetical protein